MNIYIDNPDGSQLSSYWHYIFVDYIQKVQNNITLVPDKDNTPEIDYVVNVDNFLHIYKNLHQNIIDPNYSYQDLITIYKMMDSQDQPTKELARTLILQMPFDYLLFIYYVYQKYFTLIIPMYYASSQYEQFWLQEGRAIYNRPTFVSFLMTEYPNKLITIMEFIKHI